MLLFVKPFSYNLEVDLAGFCLKYSFVSFTELQQQNKMLTLLFTIVLLAGIAFQNCNGMMLYGSLNS